MISFENTLDFAKKMDNQDPLKEYRNRFHFPDFHEKTIKYFLVTLLDFNQNQQNNIFKRNLMIGQSMVLKGIFIIKDLGIHTMKTLVNIQLK